MILEWAAVDGCRYGMYPVSDRGVGGVSQPSCRDRSAQQQIAQEAQERGRPMLFQRSLVYTCRPSIAFLRPLG
jgi:hypothetical protein